MTRTGLHPASWVVDWTGLEVQIMEWFTAYAYEPQIVYIALVSLMLASSFGLPFPEEIVILSSGLVAHIALHPELYPPPTPDAEGVRLGTLACVAFGAVFVSDMLIFLIGRFFGDRLSKTRWFQKHMPPEVMSKIYRWMAKYGFWASGIFRFTPGLRFPGHLACGMTGVPIRKFIAVDGGAALISVPTQIVLVGLYGEEVLRSLKEVKLAILVLGLGLIVFLIVRWWRQRAKARRAALPS